MKLLEEIKQHYKYPTFEYNLDFSQIPYNPIPFSQTCDIKNGYEIHHITDILNVTISTIHNGHMDNMIFNEGVPTVLHLTGSESVPYICDFIQIRYVLEGNLVSRIGKQEITFSQDELFIISENVTRHDILSSSDCIVMNINIQHDFFNDAFFNKIQMTALEKFIRGNIMHHQNINHFISFSPSTSNKEEISLMWYLYNIFRESRDKFPGYEEIITGYVIRMICACSKDYNFNLSKEEKSMYKAYLFESVTQFMQENIATVTMSMLIKKFYYQPNFFNQLIKSNTNMTYSEYLIFLRISHAKYLLKNTILSVDEIILMCGYSNKGFFYKKFKNIVGMTPRQYRIN